MVFSAQIMVLVPKCLVKIMVIIHCYVLQQGYSHRLDLEPRYTKAHDKAVGPQHILKML